MWLTKFKFGAKYYSVKPKEPNLVREGKLWNFVYFSKNCWLLCFRFGYVWGHVGMY